VVWLGGFGDEDSHKRWSNKTGELNGRADIQAWRALFGGSVELLHVPTWPAAAKILVDPTSFAEELRPPRTAHRLVPGRDPGALRRRVGRSFRKRKGTVGPGLRRRRRGAWLRRDQTTSPPRPGRSRRPRLHAKGGRRRPRPRRTANPGGPHGSPREPPGRKDALSSREQPPAGVIHIELRPAA
jgi:hypothetical protein